LHKFGRGVKWNIGILSVKKAEAEEQEKSKDWFHK